MYHAAVIIVTIFWAGWSAFGSPFPWMRMMSVFAHATGWVDKKVGHPASFYLAIGTLFGFVLVPGALDIIRAFVEQRARFTIAPEFLTGFAGPSTTGDTYSVEYVNIVIRVSNVGTQPSVIGDIEVSLKPRGEKRFYSGLIKDLSSDVDIRPRNDHVWKVPPENALCHFMNKPIESGRAVDGVLQFEMTDLHAGRLDEYGILKITLTEVHGDIFTYERPLKDTNNSPHPNILFLLSGVHQ
jgi:hypothetical protein